MIFSVCKYGFGTSRFQICESFDKFCLHLVFAAKIFDFCASLCDVGTRPEIIYPTRVHKYLYSPRPSWHLPCILCQDPTQPRSKMWKSIITFMQYSSITIWLSFSVLPSAVSRQTTPTHVMIPQRKPTAPNHCVVWCWIPVVSLLHVWARWM